MSADPPPLDRAPASAGAFCRLLAPVSSGAALICQGQRMSAGGEVLVGMAIAIGLIGVLVPVLPGLLLVWAAILVWAFEVGGSAAWTVLALVTALFLAGTVVKYVVPGRRLRRAGVPWTSTAVGALLGLVGFFVIPVVGLVVGFVLGVYLAEWQRLHAPGPAWQATKHALAAAGWSALIELCAGMARAAFWLAGVLLT
jgi:uncharacterized protein YqgC (DUF456 family)